MASSCRNGLINVIRSQDLKMAALILLWLISMAYLTILFPDFNKDINHKAAALRLEESFLGKKSITRPAAIDKTKPTSSLSRDSTSIIGASISTSERSSDHTPVVDVISIGSVSRLEYHQAQQNTWATSVRHFFNITEQDDELVDCVEQASRPAPGLKVRRNEWKNRQVYEWIEQCRANTDKTRFMFMYFKPEWVHTKDHPEGWYCAQARFGTGIRLAGQFYRKQLEQQQQPVTVSSVLPDYLILLDDDSYVQFDLLLPMLKQQSDPKKVATVWAGCLHLFFRKSRMRHNPYGGLGTIWSQRALDRMIRPIFCHESSMDSFDQHVCQRIRMDRVLEASSFKDGMSVSDLIGAFSNRIPNCFFSDWLVGYFVHEYKLSEAMYMHERFKSYLHPLHDSFALTYFRAHGNIESGLGCSGNDVCNSSTPICHYVSPLQMMNLSN